MTTDHHRRDATAQEAPRRLFSLAGASDYTTCFHAALRRAGIEVIEAVWSAQWLARTMRRGDVVNVHWPSFLYYSRTSRLKTWRDLVRTAVLLIFLRSRGVRFAWTAHNLYPHDGGRELLVHRLGRRLVVALASYVCVHGQTGARVQQEFAVPGEKLVPLEHGNWIGFYPNSVTRQEARRRLGIPPEAFTYLFIGLCKPYKNLEYLVLSHRSLQDDSLLWIVGQFQSAPYQALVTEEALRAGTDRVTIRDEFVASQDLQTYLNACDVVVLPYREILTSGAAMLALSFGKAVIAPRMGTLTELITPECGVLYDPSGEIALRDAMAAARERRFEKELILSRAEQFSWDRSAATFATRVLRGNALRRISPRTAGVS
jgi:beta-1,4-mannosyltransferase